MGDSWADLERQVDTLAGIMEENARLKADLEGAYQVLEAATADTVRLTNENERLKVENDRLYTELTGALDHLAGWSSLGAFKLRNDELKLENEMFRAALERIAGMPTSARNPDGDEQAAHAMRLVACVALGKEG